MRVFVDTWGFKSIIDKAEMKHIEVKKYLENNKKLITSDYVLDEAITLVSVKVGFSKTREFINAVESDIKKGFLELLWISPEDFEKAKQLKLKYGDKSAISFTDFTTMVLMKKNNITNIISEDRHFAEIGMGFNVLFMKN